MKNPANVVKIYQLKITLKDSKPPIWRRILVPETITLPKLHLVIQEAMGWFNYHLHCFSIGQEQYSEPFPDSDMKNEARVKLNSLLRSEKASFIYEYDFGDGWEHKIVLEKILPPDETLKLPVCTAGKLACPPEDCGGIWGYYDLLETLKDPQDPGYEDMLEWVGGEIDPEFFDIAEVNASLANVKL